MVWNEKSYAKFFRTELWNRGRYIRWFFFSRKKLLCFLLLISCSKGVRAKLPKWQLEKTTTTNESTSASTNKPVDQSPEDSPVPSTRLSSQLTVPDETDLRPGIKNNGNTSPNVLRRRHKTSQEKPHSNHKRTVSLQDMIQEDDSCQNIPEVSHPFLSPTLHILPVPTKPKGHGILSSLVIKRV